ncbi:MAG: asparagine synthase (glutamine-hydrolyzing) [Salinisphaera sp.]|jgi:asparagine synthase (glutamine-hydrolysing)|nr:asparagine synthase (glutamine-hydrolyzing) [Salinisphaera sp.]
MCGIAGFISNRKGHSEEQLADLAQRMTETLVHRGPDDSGVFTDERVQMALGFRRLSIIDLSSEGHQPMRSASGRYQLVFNGEIYNFTELSADLEKLGHRFRGHSDTEVLLAGIEQWGLTETLKRANGMLALALWDDARRELSLARDRAGKKPVYFGWVNGFFAFASELKAIRALPDFNARINRDALTLLLRHNYIAAPYSIYEGLFKLRQAEVLTLPLEAVSQRHDLADLEPYSHRFWSFEDVLREGMERPFEGTDEQACDELEACLGEAVADRMVADVPLGALLSGGIDSSTVAALMQRASATPIKTFSIGFHEEDHNEAVHAKQVAAHLGTNHTELYVSPKDVLSVIPRMPEIYDEPFGDESSIPVYLLSRLAREKVTVALSGDGGDELFAGYTRYFYAQDFISRFQKMPRSARRTLAATIDQIPPRAWNGIFGALGPILPAALREPNPGDKLHKLSTMLRQNDSVAMYRDLFSQWRRPLDAVLSANEPSTPLTDQSNRPPVRDLIERMMQLDFQTYLPENILTKVDRASMATSLEVRCPLLDPNVIALAWRLSPQLKVRDKKGKWLLREVLYRHVPKELIERPKQGFDVPVGSWLRGELRDWAEALLDPIKLRDNGFFDPTVVRRRWSEHLDGSRNWHYSLWDVLMFQAWHEHAEHTST